MNRYRFIPTMLLGMLLSLGLLTGCEDNEPVEDLGENIEELSDGVQETANDARREIDDATD